MGAIRSYRDLVAWQLAVELTDAVYDVTGGLPDAERFGLVSQLRRACVSIPSNIAEGYGRGSRSDYLRFLRMARGSVFEIDTQLLIALRRKYIPTDIHQRIEEKLHECGRVLAGLIRSVEAGAGPNA